MMQFVGALMLLSTTTGFQFKSRIPDEMPALLQGRLDRAHAEWESQHMSPWPEAMERHGGRTVMVDGEATSNTGMEDVYLEAKEAVHRLRVSRATKARQSGTKVTPVRNQPRVPKVKTAWKKKKGTFWSESEPPKSYPQKLRQLCVQLDVDLAPKGLKLNLGVDFSWKWGKDCEAAQKSAKPDASCYLAVSGMIGVGVSAKVGQMAGSGK